ncbi:hypothetical protein D9M70_425380 [compost metagenome]
MQIGEHLGKAAQCADLFEDWVSRLDSCGGQAARLQELRLGQGRARGHQAEPGEGAEDDVRQGAEVTDDEGKGTDIERLADQPHNDVFAPHGPEQPGEGHVDGHQGRGQEGDLIAQQAEARIDVEREHLEEAVDHVDVVHGSASSKVGGMVGRSCSTRNSPGMPWPEKKRWRRNSGDSGKGAVRAAGTTGSS